MKREIDFLKAYEQKTESTANIIRFLSKGLILFAVVYCICTAGVFVYWSLLSKNLNEINNKIELKKNEIRSQQKKESLYFLLKNQLSFLSNSLTREKEGNYSFSLSFSHDKDRR
jgi:hypothetical protein